MLHEVAPCILAQTYKVMHLQVIRNFVSRFLYNIIMLAVVTWYVLETNSNCEQSFVQKLILCMIMGPCRDLANIINFNSHFKLSLPGVIFPLYPGHESGHNPICSKIHYLSLSFFFFLQIDLKLILQSCLVLPWQNSWPRHLMMFLAWRTYILWMSTQCQSTHVTLTSLWYQRLCFSSMDNTWRLIMGKMQSSNQT